MTDPKTRGRKLGRPKSPDTDPATGRRGKVVAIQLDPTVLALVDWELAAMRSIGANLNRSAAFRALIVRGVRSLPAILEGALNVRLAPALLEERARLLEAMEAKLRRAPTDDD